MFKEMLVIAVNRVVDMKRIIGKGEGQGGGEAQGVADPQKDCFSWPFCATKPKSLVRNWSPGCSCRARPSWTPAWTAAASEAAKAPTDLRGCHRCS
jgi:hypothetical protein